MSPLPVPSLSNAGKTRVVTGVIHGLLRGRWQGGERLTEAAVADLFSVSRTPVREGLLELAGMGMVHLRRNCGAVLQPFGPKQLSEIYAVRALLETEATRLAVGRLPSVLLEALRTGFEALRAKKHPDTGWALDRQLHTAIATHSGNARLAVEISRYTLLVQTMREAVESVLSEIQSTSIAEHIEILDCLGRKDATGAGAAMSKHLQQAEQSALTAIQTLVRTRHSSGENHGH